MESAFSRAIRYRRFSDFEHQGQKLQKPSTTPQLQCWQRSGELVIFQWRRTLRWHHGQYRMKGNSDFREHSALAQRP